MMNRDAHLAEFERLTGLLAINSRAVVTAMRRASVALLTADQPMATVARSDRLAIRALCQEISELIPILLVRRQPVASDLRLVLAALHTNTHMDRMAALADHVAKIALSKHPFCAVPSAALPILSAMSDAAVDLAAKSSVVLATRDPIDAMQMALDDDVTDALHLKLYGLLTNEWRHGIAAAIDVAMLGRFYERFADHAVSVARPVVFIVTGETWEGRK